MIYLQFEHILDPEDWRELQKERARAWLCMDWLDKELSCPWSPPSPFLLRSVCTLNHKYCRRLFPEIVSHLNYADIKFLERVPEDWEELPVKITCPCNKVGLDEVIDRVEEYLAGR